MYQHNRIVYEELKNRLETDSRVCIVQATGTGKGVIARTLIEEYESVVVVAPTKAILENYKMNLKVNSDKVKYYTYKSVSVQLNAQLDFLAEKTNLLILDEFHRIGAKTWGRKVEYLASRVEKSNGKVVGLSATPVRYLDNERDMSVEFFNGNVINGLNIVDAVVSGVLPTFKYVVSYYGYEKDLYNEIKNKKIKLSTDIKALISNLENNYNIGEIIRKETADLSNNQKWVVFFNSIDELKSFEDTVPNWFSKTVKIYTLHSYSHYSDNMAILNSFNNTTEGVNVLLSINMLNEGVHIQGVDGVIMMRRTISPIVYLQQLGRALQVGGKKPIIFDFIGNYRRIEEYNNFSFNFIDEINSRIEKESNIPFERKIIISSYCEEIVNILNNIRSVLFPPKTHVWTKEEIELIKKYYPKGGSRLLHKKGLDYIPMQKIGDFARKLGLNYSVTWTEEEDDILRKYFPKYGSTKCIEEGLYYKNKDSICERAKILGVKYDPSIWSEEEREIIRKYYPIGGSKLCREKGLAYRTSTQITAFASHTNLNWSGKMPNYSKEEDAIILKYFPIGGPSLCKENGLNRSLSAIRSRAEYIGLKHPNGVVKWTEQEDAIILEYYQKGGVKLCQKNGLDYRNYSSIVQRASRLGLKSKPYWENWEFNILKEFFPIGGSSLCIEKGIHRSIKAIDMQAERKGIKQII